MQLPYGGRCRKNWRARRAASKENTKGEATNDMIQEFVKNVNVLESYVVLAAEQEEVSQPQEDAVVEDEGKEEKESTQKARKRKTRQLTK